MEDENLRNGQRWKVLDWLGGVGNGRSLNILGLLKLYIFSPRMKKVIISFSKSIFLLIILSAHGVTSVHSQPLESKGMCACVSIIIYIFIYIIIINDIIFKNLLLFSTSCIFLKLKHMNYGFLKIYFQI